MKNTFYFLFLAAIALAGCKKDRDPVVAPVVAKLPYENGAIKIELAATSLPVWIQAVCFTNAAIGLASTYDGKIYKTSDEGKTWTLRYTATSTANLPLVQILFTSANIGYVVGGSLSCNGAGCLPPGGLILKTTDGGTTWAVAYQASNVKITSLAVNNLGELLAISADTNARILKSTDAGATWAAVATFPYQLNKIAFDRNQGFCVGATGKILKSTDNGTTWTEVAVNFTYPYLNELAFSTGIGFCATGYSQVYKTTDNGVSWAPTPQSHFSTQVINALTPGSCLVFGGGRYSGGDFGTFDGSCRQSVDGGNSWSEIELSDISPIYYSSFYTPRNGYAVAGTSLLKVTVK